MFMIVGQDRPWIGFVGKVGTLNKFKNCFYFSFDYLDFSFYNIEYTAIYRGRI